MRPERTGLGGIAWITLLSTLLSACGGSGGDGADAGGSNTPPPPAQLAPFVLSEQNPTLYFGTAFSFFSTSRSFALIGSSLYRAFSLGNTKTVTQPCDGGGSATLALEDRDASGSLTVGDRVSISYAACASDAATLDAVLHYDYTAIDVHGGSPISIASYASAAAVTSRLIFKVQIESFTDRFDDGTVSMVGDLNIDYTFDDRVDHFLVTISKLTLDQTSAMDTQTTTVRDTTHDFRIDNRTLRYTLQMDGRIEIEAGTTRGYYTYETPVALAGVLNNYPESGDFTVHGANDSYLRAEADPLDNSFADGTLYVSDAPNEEYQEGFSWSDVMQRDVLLPVRNSTVVPVQSGAYPDGLRGRLIDFGAPAYAMVLDPARSALYVTVPGRNEVVTVSSEDYSVRQRLAVGSQPSGLAMSIDGSQLYIANAGSGTVSMIDLDTGHMSSIDVQGVLGTARAERVVEARPGVLFVTGATTALGDPHHDAIVRIDRNLSDEMHRIAFAGTLDHAQLFVDPGHRFVYLRTPSRMSQLDAADPQAPVLRSRDLQYSSTWPVEFTADGAHLLSAGEALLSDTLEPDVNYPSLTGTDVRFSLDGRRFWVLDPSDQYLDVFDTAARVQVAAYGLICGDEEPLSAATDLRPVSLTGGWALLKGQTLCVVSTLTPTEQPGVESEPAPQPPRSYADTAEIELGAVGADLAVSDATHITYVALPQAQQIALIDLASYSVVGSIPIAAGHPTGLALSADAATLYVALTNPVGLAYVDTAAATVTRVVDFSQTFASLDITDVTVVDPDHLIVTGQSGITGLLQLQPNSADAYQRIVPLARSVVAATLGPDGHSLFIGDDFGLPHIARVDLSLPTPAIVSVTDGFERTYARHIAVSPAGDRLYLEHGLVLDAATFHQVGVLGNGRPYVANAGASLRVPVVDGRYLSNDPGPVTLITYDASTFAPTRVLDTGCRASDSPQLHPAEGSSRWLMLTEERLCVVSEPN